MAPGGPLISTRLGGGFTVFTSNFVCESILSIILGPYCTIGTSFATPHVSSAYLLIKQIDPALKPILAEATMRETGKRIYDAQTNANYSRLDLLNFFNVLDWPTYHHDNRRTGATLLKGDIDSTRRHKL